MEPKQPHDLDFADDKTFQFLESLAICLYYEHQPFLPVLCAAKAQYDPAIQ